MDDGEGDGNQDITLAKEVVRTSGQEVVVAGASAVGAAVGTGVAGPAGGFVGGALGAGAGKLGVATWNALSTVWLQKRRLLFAEELDRRVAASDVPPEDDPTREEFEKKLFLVYTNMVNALDDAAIPALARLVAIYSSGRKADGFFKSMGKLLEHSDADEIAVLGRASEQIRLHAEGLPDPPEAAEEVCFDLSVDPAGEPVVALAWPHHWAFGQRTTLPVRDRDGARWATVYEAVMRAGLVHRTQPAMTYNAPPTCYIASFERLNMIAKVLTGP